jgi:DNA mismatch repair protein MutS
VASTGEFRVTELEADNSAALDHPARGPVSHRPAAAGYAGKDTRYLRTELEDWIFGFDYADRMLRGRFHLLSLDGQGLAGRHAAIRRQRHLHYLRTQRAALDHLDRPTHYDRAGSMLLDAVTVRN